MSQDCIFCKIGRGEILVPIVYEDEAVVAFIDLHPLNPGHTLVIPRSHTETIVQLDETTYRAVMDAVRLVAHKVHAAYQPPRVGVLVKGFDVAHTHVHVIPQQSGGDIVFRKYDLNLPPEATFVEREEMAQKIKSATM